MLRQHALPPQLSDLLHLTHLAQLQPVSDQLVRSLVETVSRRCILYRTGCHPRLQADVLALPLLRVIRVISH